MDQYSIFKQNIPSSKFCECNLHYISYFLINPLFTKFQKKFLDNKNRGNRYLTRILLLGEEIKDEKYIRTQDGAKLASFSFFFCI